MFTLLCHGILVRLDCLCSIQIDVFWLVYLVSSCLGLLGMCFEWCDFCKEKGVSVCLP